MIWLLGFLSLVKPFQANSLTGGITGSSNLHRPEKVQDPLVTKKWHFGCPNQNSENTFISSTSPKNDGIAFGFERLPLLDGFQPILKFGTFQPFLSCFPISTDPPTKTYGSENGFLGSPYTPAVHLRIATKVQNLVVRIHHALLVPIEIDTVGNFQ